MATGSTPCKPGRTPSGRRTEEQLVYHPSVLCSGKPDVKESRCFKYKPIGVLKTLCDVSPGVCEITVESGDKDEKHRRGTCFLGKFEVHYHPVFGLFTASHVLGERDIHDTRTKVTIAYPGLEAQHPFSQLLNVQDSPFCFTCPLLDVTFIEFGKDLQSKLSKHGFKFLHVFTQWKGCVGDEFHILHYPGKLNDHVQYFSTGHLEKYNGLHLFHSVSTEEGSSGAPVVFGNGCDVVAIHTAQSEDAENNYNVAVSVDSVFKVLIANWESAHSNQSPSCLVTHHPTENEMLSLMDQLEDLGLEMQRARQKGDQNGTPRIPFYYTHEGLRVSDENEKVAIHFVLTSHGWYWSELAPDNGVEEPSWTSAAKNVFGDGSHYRGKTVQEEPNGFSFGKLRSVGLSSLPSKFGRLSISNKEKEYST